MLKKPGQEYWKRHPAPDDINYIIAGDLLNQCIATTFGLRGSSVPYLGIYGACSTICESLGIGSMLIDGGFADNVVCITSSHFALLKNNLDFLWNLGRRDPISPVDGFGCGGR